MSSEGKPTALIVHENRITANRVKSILSQRGWASEICDDGDKAVDEFVRLNPGMVFMGLNLPTMDGHVAALEMRESDPEARVIFVVSKARLEKANDAAFSAGAVAVLTTPLTRADFDQNWVMMNGPIPDAPGLADLDELYPELEDEDPAPPQFPELPPMDEIPPMPVPDETPKKKRRLLPALILLLLLAGAAAGAALFMGAIEI
ncbi:MAG: hypothetical protein CMA88_02345 [Euryarchaeota archaeon]|nr:hypothetical protein [Euryarchaeota archaeon]